MMGLGSILARRHLYDLFKLAKLYSIDAVSFLTRQEWHSVLAFADSAQLNDDVMRSRVENYVELAMEDEEIWEVGEDECDDEEARKDLERFRQNERRLTKAMWNRFKSYGITRLFSKTEHYEDAKDNFLKK